MDAPSHAMLAQPRVTVVVSPRERFSLAKRSLDSLFRHTAGPFDLIYVATGAPAAIAHRLRSDIEGRGFRFIHHNHYVTPNQARNLALPHVRTKYIAFVDNDVLFTPGWLDALIGCAEESGADIVTPIICIGEPVHTVVHFAGGDASIYDRDGRRFFHESHAFFDARLDEVKRNLVRRPTELAEFHCMPVRSAAFEKHGRLDEGLMCTAEHVDLCMAVRAGGGSVYVEPGAVITYLTAALSIRDLPYYVLRWSDEWEIATSAHFYRKWRAMDECSDTLLDRFVRPQRRHSLPKLRNAIHKSLGWRWGARLCDAMDRLIAGYAKRRFVGVTPSAASQPRRSPAEAASG